MGNRSRCVVVLSVLLMASWPVLADPVIGVNFVDQWETPHLGGETADGLSNWTDSVPVGGSGEQNGTGLVLLGSNDLVTCDWSSANTWAAGSEGTSEQQLYRVYLDDGNNGPVVTLTGLSDWMASEGLGSYTVRIYHSTDNGAGFTAVDISSEGTILETVQETNRWTTDGGVRAYVDSGILTANTITLDTQARTGNGGSDLRATIAGVKITGIDAFIPINPDPEIGVETTILQIMSWEQAQAAGGLGVTYDVYFGTDPNALSPTYYGLTPVKTTTTDPADFYYDHGVLDTSATYYWRVDAIDPNEPGVPVVYTGPEWWFTTQPPSARIETDPVSQTVAAGTAEVQFSVTGINIASYQWYKDGVALTDDLTDTLYTGENTATLTIYDVQIDDEGFYHCEADNSLEQPDASAAAQLLTQRLVGWWKLDGDLTDSIDEEIAGAAAHDGVCTDPNYVAIGKDGGAMQFYGDPEGIVTITESGEFFNFYPRGYTVSAWVNMPEKTSGDWGAYVVKQGQDPSRGFILTHQGGGQAVHTLRQSFGDLGSNTDVDDNDWHLVTGTYDSVNKEGRIFVDGVQTNQATSTGTPTPSPAALIFGAEQATGEVAYIGLLDDVRIWNYPLDPVTVATMYVDFNPGSEVCVTHPVYDVAGPNGTGDEFRDCVVNLYDFVPFAEDWLSCNLVPNCLP